MKDILFRLMPDKLPGFLIVGTIGLLVDAAVLALLVFGFGWGNYSARLVSFSLAVTVTWVLNRNFVFSDGKRASRKEEYMRYLTMQGVGMALNYGIYSTCIILSERMNDQPLIALFIGSACAMVINYLGLRFFVFTGARKPDASA